MSARAGVRQRVAIIAFTSQPGRGSEYEVGWRWALLAGRIARAWVLTRRACWDAIPGRPRRLFGWRIKRAEGALFVAIDLSDAEKWFPGIRLMRIHYLLWQILAWRWLRAHRRGFAFVHQLTFVAAWFPPFAAFAGLPLLWGPIGTTPPMPAFYRNALPWRARVAAAVRKFVTQAMVRGNPLLPLVGRRTRAAFAISEHVRELLPASLRPRTRVHPAIAIDPAWALVPDRAATSETLLFVGRGMDFKLPRLALDVARRVVAGRPTASAVMIGEGLPQLLGPDANGDRIAVREGITQGELRTLYGASGLFVFPSVEGSGFVTLEAMASGLPVACLEGTGAAYFSGPDNPLTVSAEGDWDAVAGRLSEAILSCMATPERFRAAGEASRVRVRLFAWENYAAFLSGLYSEMAQPVPSSSA